MAVPQTVAKIKTFLRISNSALDDEIDSQIESCLADLRLVGVEADEYDDAILAAIKMYCKAYMNEDMTVANSFMERYNEMKKNLIMAEGYGLTE